MVPKVSPLRGMAIDDWITTYAKGWQADVVARVIATVKKAAPGASASIKWRMPVFEQDGPFLFLRTAKAHVSVGFWRGAELETQLNGLERGGRMAHVKIRSLQDLDARALTAAVKEAVRLNRAKGSPATSRG